jgi:hydroxyacylglutathione hydrolase
VEFFNCEKVAAHVTRIADPTNVYAYLVEGTERAALIDTGSGIGNLKAFVGSLTRLPVVVICTHGHVDHASGTFGFDTVYLNEKDHALAKIHTTVEFRRDFIGDVAAEDLVPQRASGYLNLSDGQVFDLDGLTLEAVALPGHTQGSMCILLRELRILLLGDACNSGTFLFLPESSTVEQYKHELRNLLRREREYDAVWFSHPHNGGAKTIVNECIEVCDAIMAGKTDDAPFSFVGQTARIAMAINPDFSRVDGKTANIVYHPDKVFNK